MPSSVLLPTLFHKSRTISLLRSDVLILPHFPIPVFQLSGPLPLPYIFGPVPLFPLSYACPILFHVILVVYLLYVFISWLTLPGAPPYRLLGSLLSRFSARADPTLLT